MCAGGALRVGGALPVAHLPSWRPSSPSLNLSSGRVATASEILIQFHVLKTLNFSIDNQEL
jgi:hypothetical protein